MSNERTPAKSRTAAGQFPKGVSGNPRGRTPGQPNKITERIRETIHAALEDSAGDVAGWLRTLGEQDPKSALQVYAALAEFALPKLSRQEVKADPEPERKYVIRFRRGNDWITPGHERGES